MRVEAPRLTSKSGGVGSFPTQEAGNVQANPPEDTRGISTGTRRAPQRRRGFLIPGGAKDRHQGSHLKGPQTPAGGHDVFTILPSSTAQLNVRPSLPLDDGLYFGQAFAALRHRVACLLLTLRSLYSTMKAPFLIGAVAKRPRPVRIGRYGKLYCGPYRAAMTIRAWRARDASGF
jgi:hypothetical protein